MQERRQTKRYPVAPDRDGTLLKVCDDVFDARIVDESTGGFAIQVHGHPAVYEGEHVWLRYEGAWTAGHVTNIVPNSDGCRLGLERHAQVTTQQPESLDKISCNRGKPRRMLSRAWIPLAFGLSLVTAWFVVPFLKTGRFAPLEFKSQPDASVGSPTVEAAEIETYTSLEGRLRKMGAKAFTTPDVQRILKLTSAQNERLADILHRWERTTAMAVRNGAEETSLRKLSAQAEHEALAVLSQAQRERWFELLNRASRLNGSSSRGGTTGPPTD